MFRMKQNSARMTWTLSTVSMGHVSPQVAAQLICRTGVRAAVRTVGNGACAEAAVLAGDEAAARAAARIAQQIAGEGGGRQR